MRVAYGLKVREQNDPYIDTAERLLKYLETAIMPGRWLVEFLPIRAPRHRPPPAHPRS
jgi:hypothetical protein